MYWKEYNKHKTTRTILKIAIIVIILIGLPYTYMLLAQSPTEPAQTAPDDTDPFTINDPPTPPGSNRLIDKGRHVLTAYDESEHRLSKREWWYFNVFFSDDTNPLHNWSMIISFNKMAANDIRFLKRDNFFLILYDDIGNCYSYNLLDKPRGTLTAGQNGVDIQFGPNHAHGQYPEWTVHAESKNNELIIDLSFIADFIPVWVEGRSSNLIFGGYVAGDYYIPRCNVTGTMHWKQTTYNITGIGYHDHVWETNIPRFITTGWEWFNIHCTNGWEMYISRFNLRRIRDLYAGAIIISPNTRDLVEFNKYELTKQNLQTATDYPRITYPETYILDAERDNMKLHLEIQIYTICEIVWRRARTGMFEGPCHITGTFSWDNHTVTLDGFGMSEVTIVQYLLQKPNILERLRQKF